MDPATNSQILYALLNRVKHAAYVHLKQWIPGLLKRVQLPGIGDPKPVALRLDLQLTRGSPSGFAYAQPQAVVRAQWFLVEYATPDGTAGEQTKLFEHFEAVGTIVDYHEMGARLCRLLLTREGADHPKWGPILASIEAPAERPYGPFGTEALPSEISETALVNIRAHLNRVADQIVEDARGGLTMPAVLHENVEHLLMVQSRYRAWRADLMQKKLKPARGPWVESTIIRCNHIAALSLPVVHLVEEGEHAGLEVIHEVTHIMATIHPLYEKFAGIGNKVWFDEEWLTEQREAQGGGLVVKVSPVFTPHVEQEKTEDGAVVRVYQTSEQITYDDPYAEDLTDRSGAPLTQAAFEEAAAQLQKNSEIDRSSFLEGAVLGKPFMPRAGNILEETDDREQEDA